MRGRFSFLGIRFLKFSFLRCYPFPLPRALVNCADMFAEHTLLQSLEASLNIAVVLGELRHRDLAHGAWYVHNDCLVSSSESLETFCEPFLELVCTVCHCHGNTDLMSGN